MTMVDKRDLPDDLMQVLKARSCDRAMYDVHLEERIMQEFSKRQHKSRRRMIAALIAVGAIVLGGVGFAAAGGIQAVKRYFTLVELVPTDAEAPTGPVYLYLEGQELHDADGNAVGEIQITDSNGTPVNTAAAAN
jgi:hypothetical protein